MGSSAPPPAPIVSSTHLHLLFALFCMVAIVQGNIGINSTNHSLNNLTPFLANFIATAPLIKIERVNGTNGWVETWSKNRAGKKAQPFAVELGSTNNIVWNQSKWNCRQLVKKYGHTKVLYQHLSDGTLSGDQLKMWDGVLLSVAIWD